MRKYTVSRDKLLHFKKDEELKKELGRVYPNGIPAFIDVNVLARTSETVFELHNSKTLWRLNSQVFARIVRRV